MSSQSSSTRGRSLGRFRAGGEVVAVIVAFLATAVLIGPTLGVPLAALALYGGVLAGWGFLRLSGQRWADLGFRAPEDRRAAVITALGIALVGLALYGGVRALERVGLTPLDLSPLRDAVQGDPAMFLVTLALVVWGSAAFAEELIFRGFVFDRLTVVFRGVPGQLVWASVLQALLFGLAHSYQGWTGMVVSASIGLLMAMIYVARDRNLWVPILAHGFMDTVAVTLLYFGLL